MPAAPSNRPRPCACSRAGRCRAPRTARRAASAAACGPAPAPAPRAAAGRRRARAAGAAASPGRARPCPSVRRCARVRRSRVAVEAEADIVGDAEMRKQRAVLRHDADAAPVGRHARRRRRPAPRRPARCGPRPAPRSRRSGAAAWSCREPDGPTIAVRLPAGDVEVDAVQRRDGAVALADAAEFEKAHRPAIRRDWA